MNSPTLKKGLVWISTLKQKGILLGPGRPGTYKVLVNSAIVDFAETELVPFGGQHDNEAPVDRIGKGARLGKFESRPMLSVTLALHGLNPKDAVEMVERKINRAVLSDADRIKIIHGDEKGKIRRAIHEYLERSRVVKSFEDDAERPDVTWVYFRTSH